MACLALGLGLLLAPLPAQAQGPSLKDFLFGHPSGTELAPGRYAPQEGEPFLIDHSGDGAVLVRFADSAEVWVLKPYSGPRGDVIYKNDVGDEILRATRLGGLTFFSHLHPTGEATAYYGEASGLKLAPVPSPTVLFQAMVQASVRASRAVQHLVVFEAEDLSPHDLEPTSGALIADAAANTADAFSRLADQGQVQGVVHRHPHPGRDHGHGLAIDHFGVQQGAVHVEHHRRHRPLQPKQACGRHAPRDAGVAAARSRAPMATAASCPGTMARTCSP